MQHVANLVLRRFRESVRGAVLVEFAFCLPVLLLLYLGGYGVSDMVACNRKVGIATRALADLVSRTKSPAIIYNAPQEADATPDLSAAAVVLAPYRLDNAVEQISLLRVCDASHAYVVWTQAQTQNANGSTIVPTTSNQTAGTLPANQSQTADNVVSIPSAMVTTPLIPVSPDGSNVCKNLDPGTSNKTQVGTAGGWLYMGQVKYNYTPSVAFLALGSRTMTDTIYMTPRLF
jgi:Flp pilus assembly protein TadG